MSTNNKKKTTEKMTDKFDFTDSIKAIKDTAKSVNTHVKEVVEEVTEDLKESGEQLKDMAVAPVKKVKDITVEPVKKVYGKAYETFTEKVNMETLTKTAKSVNNYTLKTAEEVVDGVIESGEKWQGITAKAVKGSLKLAAKQQAIVFDTLETVKGQFIQNAGRFRKLFSKN